MALHKIFAWATAAVALALPSATFALTSSDFTRLTGINTSDGLGRAVASGDINGDGYDDMVVGAPGNATGFISIVYGSDTLPSALTLSTSNSAIITGNGSTDYFGANIAVGDVNGDGFADIAVGAVGDTTAGAANSGAVYLLYGGENEISSGTVASNVNMAKFTSGVGFKTGASISIGDINGDEYDDVLIGSTNDAATGGSVSIVYGQEANYSGTSNSISGLPKFTGESNGNTFGNSSAVGDVNGDGLDDIFIGAELNDDSGVAAGSAYIFYGQEDEYSGSTAASSVAEVTGEAAGDNAGTSVAIGEVTGDEYDDLLITSDGNDDGATDAGAVYVIPGSGTAYSATTTSLSDFTEFTGITASDTVSKVAAVDVDGDEVKEIIASSQITSSSAGAIYLLDGNETSGSLSVGTTMTGSDTEKFGSALGGGDINGDGFQELLVGAKAYTSGTGSLLVGALLIDTDGDGVAGSGLLLDLDETIIADCDDADATVSVDQTFYIDADSDGLGDAGTTTTACSSTAPDGYTNNDSDTNDTIPNAGLEIGEDGIDNDSDGLIDEVNTVEENGEHPYYGTLSPTEAEEVAVNITSVTGAAAGIVTVTYADGSVYDYKVLTTASTKATLVQQYTSTGYGVVLDRKGKLIELVNLYNGDIATSKQLSTKAASSANFLLKDVRKDGKTEAVVTTVRKKKVTLYMVKVTANSAKLSLKDTVKVASGKVATNKTKVKKSTVTLRTSKGKTVDAFKVNKKYRFVE